VSGAVFDKTHTRRVDFMKRLIMTMFVIAIGAGVYAQNNFFASKAGTVLTNTVTVVTTVSWYAPNIGTVKTETYDDKNNLISGSVLAELKGN
jgi:putative effector of murein hydrolase